MTNELRKNNCRLEIYTNMPDDENITGSMGNLIQVIEVMISNAIEAYPDGDGQIDLNILSFADKIEISVQDYGMGIPQNIQDKLLNINGYHKRNQGDRHRTLHIQFYYQGKI